ncbi:MAG TPA: hypothetical protein DCP91_10490 [Eggerthellaceae bacterium]|nr:hypothetical protein [Eggerthellaceae bacterium]
MDKPVAYVSYFLKKNRVEYYDRMSEVRRSGNYEQRVKFFLEAVNEAADDAVSSIESLRRLHCKNESLLPRTNRSKDTLRMVFDYAEKRPILSIANASTSLGLSYNTVSKQVNALVDFGILEKTSDASRNRVYSYRDYIEILKRGME